MISCARLNWLAIAYFPILCIVKKQPLMLDLQQKRYYSKLFKVSMVHEETGMTIYVLSIGKTSSCLVDKTSNESDFDCRNRIGKVKILRPSHWYLQRLLASFVLKPSIELVALLLNKYATARAFYKSSCFT